MNHELLGWLSCIFFILGCSYSLFKRFKVIGAKIKLPLKKLLDYHCIFSAIATIIGFLHAGRNLSNIRFSTGYVTLLLMLLVTLLGIFMKYFKKAYAKKRVFWLYTHILLAIMLFGSILLHIFTYLLLQLT